MIAIGVVGGYALLSATGSGSGAARGLATEPLGIVAAAGAPYWPCWCWPSWGCWTQERAVNPAFNSLKGVPYVVPIIVVFLIG